VDDFQSDCQERSDIYDLDAAIAAMAAMGAAVPIGAIAAQLPNLIRTIEHHCPIKTAATFGGLLLKKRLQTNCLRLEILVHLCLCFGRGKRAPTQSLIKQGFTAVGAACGHLEDPPEDVFVGNIYSKRGNYRVLEGIWECATFYLQRIVNLVDSLPVQGQFKSIADTVHALLLVSDLVCERADLVRNDIGSDGRNRDLPLSLLEKSTKLRELVKIDRHELHALNIDIDLLGPFIFELPSRADLANQEISNTLLEVAPLAMQDGCLYLLLPTAVSVAIRQFFIQVLGQGDNRDIFLKQLGREYSQLFSTNPFFGEVGPKLSFVHRSWGGLCALGQEVDAGRYLNMVFFLDDLSGFENGGFGGVFYGNAHLQVAIRDAIEGAQKACEQQSGFKDGFTLIVGCGVGRGVVLDDFYQPRANWAREFVSAPNLITLGRMRGIQALDLWRVSQMEFALKRHGVSLHNMNGLLNLFAWADALNGHLIPHEQIPPELCEGEIQLLMPITQNGLASVRHECALAADEHVELFVDGTWKLIRKKGHSIFEEDNSSPLYVYLGRDDQRKLLGAKITARRCWWYEAFAQDGAEGRLIYERWQMMGVWVARIANSIDARFGTELGTRPIYWRSFFSGVQGTISCDDLGSEDDLIDTFVVHVSHDERTIDVLVGPGFEKAIFHPSNIAEVGLVKSLLTGLAELACLPVAVFEDITSDVLSDVNARHCHAFSTNGYRDYFQHEVSHFPVTINRFDDARLKLGLGWQVRDMKDGGNINGKENCLVFLRALVDQLQGELSDRLKSFNRLNLLKALLLNYESASHSRDRWKRTAAAMLALREDKVQAMEVMSKHEFKLNAVLQTTRILIEMALCESPLDNGQTPGELDFSLMLAQAAQIFHLSGWADLIHWDLLEPELIVRPLGDVHAHHDFMDMVIEPFGMATSGSQFAISIKKYAQNLSAPAIFEDSSQYGISADFLDAWKQEFGIPFDAFRRFVDALEDYGIESREMLFTLSRRDLLKMADDPEVGAIIIDSIQLETRPEWRIPPEGYTWRDIAPSKFKRRLGLLRRPLIQISGGNDPTYLIDPALIREGFSSMARNYHDGGYSDEHLGEAMRRYAGLARQRDGADFNERVASKMEALGWKVEREVNVTKVLGKKLDRNYGDVDVLAWSPVSNRVLILECKDLQFKKTYGEIAEQLSDYRGWASSDGKKRDSLRKHLDRMNVFQSNTKELARFVGLQTAITPESHLVFSHPVPMMFSSSIDNEAAVTHAYDSLCKI
jgi:hypothetical protein